MMKTATVVHTLSRPRTNLCRYALGIMLATGLGLGGLAQAGNPIPLTTTHGLAPKPKPHLTPRGVSTPAPTAPVRKLCPELGVVSFRIVGAVPVTGKGGDRSYRLRLQGVVQNFGDSYRGPIGEVKILERMPGARGKFISHQRPHNLAHSKQLMIGALTQPFALSTEFLPDYDLLAYTDLQHRHKSCRKNSGMRGSARITSQMLRAALRH